MICCLVTTPIAGNLLFFRRSDELGNLTYESNGEKWTRMSSPMDSISWDVIGYDKKDSSYWVAAIRRLVHFSHDFRPNKRIRSCKWITS